LTTAWWSDAWIAKALHPGGSLSGFASTQCKRTLLSIVISTQIFREGQKKPTMDMFFAS
jgi:hypothetical protein